MNNETRVDSYTTPLDAELAKAYLASHNVDVRLEGEILNSSAFALGPILGGVQLYVAEEDGDRASKLLTEYHDKLREEHIAKGESNDQLTTRACIAAYIGFVTIPILVHAYSVWILFHVDKGKLTPEKRYRYPLAWAGNTLAFGLLLLWITMKLISG